MKSYVLNENEIALNFGSLFDDAILKIAELSEAGEIPVWNVYSVNRVDRLDEMKIYYITLIDNDGHDTVNLKIYINEQKKYVEIEY